MDIDAMITQLKDSIFAFDGQSTPNLLTELMTAVIELQLIDINDPKKLQTFNQIMMASLEALQRMDYLLLADLIEFELIPIFTKAYKN